MTNEILNKITAINVTIEADLKLLGSEEYKASSNERYWIKSEIDDLRKERKRLLEMD